MGELSHERMKLMEDASHLYFDWVSVLAEAGITDVQDLHGQYLLKCPFHPDKRPSFRIRVAEHNYHCFSCNAFGSVLDLMWRVSGSTMKKNQYMEQVLKANPAMQEYLGFKSIYLDHTTLNEGFNSRRRFSAKDHIGSSMPLSVFMSRAKKCGRTWENLAYSLTMMQSGERLDSIISAMKRNPSTPKTGDEQGGTISLADLLLED